MRRLNTLLLVLLMLTSLLACSDTSQSTQSDCVGADGACSIDNTNLGKGIQDGLEDQENEVNQVDGEEEDELSSIIRGFSKQREIFGVRKWERTIV